MQREREALDLRERQDIVKEGKRLPDEKPKR